MVNYQFYCCENTYSKQTGTVSVISFIVSSISPGIFHKNSVLSELSVWGMGKQAGVKLSETIK